MVRPATPPHGAGRSKRVPAKHQGIHHYVARVCIRCGLTREQAVNESISWLMLLDEAWRKSQGESALMISDAVLAGTAPGALKNGDRVAKKIRNHFQKLAEI